MKERETFILAALVTVSLGSSGIGVLESGGGKNLVFGDASTAAGEIVGEGAEEDDEETNVSLGKRVWDTTMRLSAIALTVSIRPIAGDMYGNEKRTYGNRGADTIDSR